MKFNQSNLLKQFSSITSAFTTKQSGNLAFHVGDVADNVVKNHKLLANDLAYNYKNLVHMKQIHSNRVHILTKNDNFFNVPTCDALITNEKNRPLMVMVADCAPILFYDCAKKVIAVAHAGRAGAFGNITGNVIDSFKNSYGSNPQDIAVSIGASIQKCCYEVGPEINEQAKELHLEYAMRARENSYYLNIASILKKQLLNAGVLDKNIEISSKCSACTTEEHYSYRAEKETGRFAGIIYLRE